MKIKLISLLIALLCISVLFVSCSDPCVEHIDADNDGICDVEDCEDAVKKPEIAEHEHKDGDADSICDTENCGTVIITNTVENRVEVLVPIAKEEYVPMVVKTVPSDAILGDYVNIVYENGTLTLYAHKYSPAEKNTELKIVEDLGNHYYIIKTTVKVSDPVADNPETPDDDEFKYATRKDTYTLINDITNTAVELITTEAYDFEEDNVATPDVNEYWDEAPSFNYYELSYGLYAVVLGGEDYYFYTENYTKLNTEAFEFDSIYDIYEYLDEYLAVGNNKTLQFTNDETVYVIDENGDIIYSEKEIFFIDRPEFDYVTDSFGIIEDETKLSFFDLSKWLECTYTYSFEYGQDSDWWLLQNGNVFVQVEKALPYDAINYDFKDSDGKFDLDYFVVDPAAKTVTETEFGYYVTDVKVNDGESEALTDKLENVFMVNPIVNGVIVESESKTLAVSNAIEVVCDLSSADGDGAMLVSDGLYVKRVSFNDEDYLAVYDASGKFLNYLPDSVSDFFDDCIILGGEAVYTYDLKLKLDLTKYEYYEPFGAYMLLVEEVKTVVEEVETYVYNTYYWNTSLEAPVLLFKDSDAKELRETNVNYFVVKVPTIVTDPDTQQSSIAGYTYSIYSSSNVLICSGVDAYDFNTYTIDGEEYVTLETSTSVTTQEGTTVNYGYYIVNDVAPAPAPDPAPAA